LRIIDFSDIERQKFNQKSTPALTRRERESTQCFSHLFVKQNGNDKLMITSEQRPIKPSHHLKKFQNWRRRWGEKIIIKRKSEKIPTKYHAIFDLVHGTQLYRFDAAAFHQHLMRHHRGSKRKAIDTALIFSLIRSFLLCLTVEDSSFFLLDSSFLLVYCWQVRESQRGDKGKGRVEREGEYKCRRCQREREQALILSLKYFGCLI
jgi:hypothetical protein